MSEVVRTKLYTQRFTTKHSAISCRNQDENGKATYQIFCPHCKKGFLTDEKDIVCKNCGAQLEYSDTGSDLKISNINVFQKGDKIQIIIRYFCWKPNGKINRLFPYHELSIITINLKTGLTYLTNYYETGRKGKPSIISYGAPILVSLKRYKKLTAFLKSWLEEYYNHQFNDNESLGDMVKWIRFYKHPESFAFYNKIRKCSKHWVRDYKKICDHLHCSDEKFMQYLCYGSGTVPKSIKRMMAENIYLKFVYNRLRRVCKFTNIDVLRDALKTDWEALYVLCLILDYHQTSLKTDFINATIKEFPNERQRMQFFIAWADFSDSDIIIDTMRMWNKLRTQKDNSIKEIWTAYCRERRKRLCTHSVHDLFVIAINSIDWRNCEIPFSEQWRILENTIDDYNFIVPKSSKELLNVGSALHNCVYSYLDRILDGECIIVYIKKKNKIGACIELCKTSHGQLKALQALGPCNNLLDKKERAVFIEWAKQNTISIKSCYGIS